MTHHYARHAAVSLLGAIVGAGLGLWLYTSGTELGTAVVGGIGLGGIATGILGIGAWFVWPYPIDVEAMLGGPDDVFWSLRDSPRWQRFATWINRHAEAHG